MAGEGGYERPSGPRAPGGPGALATREDANQPIRTPDLDDPGVQSGDVQAAVEAQRAAAVPTATGRGAGVSPAARAGAGGGSRSGGGSGELPPWFFDLGSQRPSEPPTEGLSVGPGNGPEVLQNQAGEPDMRELILDYFANNYGNADAARMRDEIRNGRRESDRQPLMPSGPAAMPAAQEPELDDDFFGTGGSLFDGGEEGEIVGEAAFEDEEEIPEEPAVATEEVMEEETMTEPEIADEEVTEPPLEPE